MMKPRGIGSSLTYLLNDFLTVKININPININSAANKASAIALSLTRRKIPRAESSASNGRLLDTKRTSAPAHKAIQAALAEHVSLLLILYLREQSTYPLLKYISAGQG